MSLNKEEDKEEQERIYEEGGGVEGEDNDAIGQPKL